MKLLILNGPNLNLLGLREPNIYGSESYAELCERIRSYADERGIEVRLVQSNHEGELVDAIQQAYFDGLDGIVLNPGAYTHTSIALLDALKGVGLPAVEVHISDPDTREEFRRISFVRAACLATIKGHGTQGYFEAIDLLIDRLREA
jgi:3-dehydroquinate dehydratase type II